MVRRGPARQGLIVYLGMAWCGEHRLGAAGLGLERHGEARLGKVGLR